MVWGQSWFQNNEICPKSLNNQLYINECLIRRCCIFFTEDVAPKTRTVVREGADIVATGGMDDVVRIWDVTADGELKLKHKLTDHSLGVVSVALNKDVTRKTI